ncbi:MAG TPA: hypothetical protein VLG46_01135 [Anaerolineae bacterium]|nr:hypothetical protein [Anaerolineae bacterium]
MDYTRPRFEVMLITTAFQITGQIEPVGTWLDFLNARDKFTVTVHNAHILAIGTSVGPAPEKPQAYVNRNDICFIYLPDRNSHQSVYMLKNLQTAIAHLGPVICRGEWHMGVDATLATFVDDLPGHFFPITNADLHAKIALPAPLPHKAELILVNRQHVALYHAV